MTNEERQKLCDWLRHLPAYLSEDGMQAADEIERLAKDRREAIQGRIRAEGALLNVSVVVADYMRQHGNGFNDA